jgi:hypothetical protein
VLGPLGRAPAQLLQAPGELVAQALELPEREQAGALRRQPAAVGAEVREAVGDDRRALALEPCHLRAQRAARSALARLDRRRGGGSAPNNRCLLSLAHYRLLLTARCPDSTTPRSGKRRGAAPQRLFHVELGHAGDLHRKQREPARARTGGVPERELGEQHRQRRGGVGDDEPARGK